MKLYGYMDQGPKVMPTKTDTDLAEKLLEKGIALVPGSAFGTLGHMRISFSTSNDNLQKAIERLTAATA